jgi:hypothetical protein
VPDGWPAAGHECRREPGNPRLPHGDRDDDRRGPAGHADGGGSDHHPRGDDSHLGARGHRGGGAPTGRVPQPRTGDQASIHAHPAPTSGKGPEAGAATESTARPGTRATAEACQTTQTPQATAPAEARETEATKAASACTTAEAAKTTKAPQAPAAKAQQTQAAKAARTTAEAAETTQAPEATGAAHVAEPMTPLGFRSPERTSASAGG